VIRSRGERAEGRDQVIGELSGLGKIAISIGLSPARGLFSEVYTRGDLPRRSRRLHPRGEGWHADVNLPAAEGEGDVEVVVVGLFHVVMKIKPAPPGSTPPDGRDRASGPYQPPGRGSTPPSLRHVMKITGARSRRALYTPIRGSKRDSSLGELSR
jgi:hypothetical protein